MTTEIVVSPPAASFEAFDWRISMANVASDGPFSAFAGIDRSLALLEGHGLDLDCADRGTIAVRPGRHPAVFPGDVAVTARLVDGPIVDLNVMTRRGRWRHFLSMVPVERALRLPRQGDVTAILLRGAGGEADGRAVVDGATILLTAADGDNAVEIEVQEPCRVWVADLWRMEPA